MTYPEALKAVAKRYGIEVREKEMTPEEVARNDNREYVRREQLGGGVFFELPAP